MNGLWICTSQNSSIPYEQYTQTNTQFSYTFIYEHTDKHLLTHNEKYNTQHKHRWEGGLDCLLAHKVCLQGLSSQCCFKKYL